LRGQATIEGASKATTVGITIDGRSRPPLTNAWARATNAGRDPDYPGNRQTADLHLRKLICKALRLSGWSVHGAAAFLAGEGDAAAKERLVGRIETFLQNLEKRMEREPAEGAGDPDGALARWLEEEWKGSVSVVLEVVRALRHRRIH